MNTTTGHEDRNVFEERASRYILAWRLDGERGGLPDSRQPSADLGREFSTIRFAEGGRRMEDAFLEIFRAASPRERERFLDATCLPVMCDHYFLKDAPDELKRNACEYVASVFSHSMDAFPSHGEDIADSASVFEACAKAMRMTAAAMLSRWKEASELRNELKGEMNASRTVCREVRRAVEDMFPSIRSMSMEGLASYDVKADGKVWHDTFRRGACYLADDGSYLRFFQPHGDEFTVLYSFTPGSDLSWAVVEDGVYGGSNSLRPNGYADGDLVQISGCEFASRLDESIAAGLCTDVISRNGAKGRDGVADRVPGRDAHTSSGREDDARRPQPKPRTLSHEKEGLER